MNINKKTIFSILAALAVIACLAFTVAGKGIGAGAQAPGTRTSSPSPLKNALSGSAQVAQALHAGTLKLNNTHAPVRAHQTMTCSPAPCVLPNTQASEGGQPVNETAIAVNPNNPLDVMTSANDYNCTSSLDGIYNSTDGGTTWKTNCMGTFSGAVGCGDPGVGFDLNNVAYATSIENCGSAANAPSSIILEKSTDNGTTWSAPAIAVNPYFSGGDVDKPWLQLDDNPGSPHANTLYISTTQFDFFSGTLISVSHSSDGGATWTTTAVEPETGFGGVDQFSSLTIGKDGTVYVSWMHCQEFNSECAGTVATFYFAKSTDGGNTWSTPTIIGVGLLTKDTCSSRLPCFYGSVPGTTERTSDIPVIGIDNSTGPFHAYLYAAFYSWTGTFMAVEVATSIDGGNTWGAPVPVGRPNSTHDQFFPWLTVSSGGIVAVTWMDRRDDPLNISYKAYFTYSTNGGLSFAPDKNLGTALSNPFNDGFGGVFMGDYTGSIWTGSTTPTLYASWPDTRNTVTSQDEVGGYIK